LPNIAACLLLQPSSKVEVHLALRFSQGPWMSRSLEAACTAMVRKGKIIVYIATSADGFIARPDRSVDWLDRPRPKGN
jgi:hypothetical protein